MTQQQDPTTSRERQTRWYVMPDDIAVYSSPCRGYLYEPSKENPNVWEPVRMLTEEERKAEDLQIVRRKAQVEATLKGDQERTAVYRLRNADGELLYVGVSCKPQRRWVRHSEDQAWWGDVTEFSQEWFESRLEALAVEAFSIRTEAPTHNTLHKRSSTD